MCGLFGQISQEGRQLYPGKLRSLAKSSERRGSDSSGAIVLTRNELGIYRGEFGVTELLRRANLSRSSSMIIGFSRMKTNSEYENQPYQHNDIYVLHNGIIVNSDSIYSQLNLKKVSELDSAVIPAIVEKLREKSENLEEICREVIRLCSGQIAALVYLPRLGQVCLFSNNGSLFIGELHGTIFFASERFSLTKIKCSNIREVREPIVIPLDPVEMISNFTFNQMDASRGKVHLPNLVVDSALEKHLEFDLYELKRCKICILPMTFPFIEFDEFGRCNYCLHYVKTLPAEDYDDGLLREIRNLNIDESRILVPVSGGRDSVYALHYLKKVLELDVVAFTYDWGFVTDLARRNISRIIGNLGVEHILVSADLRKKRNNVRKNLLAWLDAPELGLLSLLTAGDKFFFKFSEIVMRELSLNVQCWGVNSLETTHFKTGFLGIRPAFQNNGPYQTGLAAQINYQLKRTSKMSKNIKYFNSSLTDTLMGEYYRSRKSKTGYLEFFRFHRWEEGKIENALLEHAWERATDSSSTWRIGDATAPFYNYVHYTVAGFTEHDTFRSNMVREGLISRDKALELVKIENMPRYINIKAYLDLLGVDFTKTIRTINNIEKIR